MEPMDLRGHAAFTDQRRDEEINTPLRLTLDLQTGRVIVGEGDTADEVEFHERSARHSLGEVVSALRRHAYRRRPIRPVPKPQRTCDVCRGERVIVNPYSGERFPCPVCGE